MLRRIFETGLEKIGRIISAQHNINIVFQGNGAYTDGQTIYLPSTDELSDDLMQDLHGFLDHEVSHCLFSDFTQFKKLRKGKGKRFQKELLNAVEDVRIEREIVKEYPGCKYNLEPLNTKLKGKLEKEWDKLQFLVKFIYSASCQMECGKYPEDPKVERLMKLNEDLIAKFNDCKTTDELRKIADKITERVIDYIEKPPESDKKGEGDESKGKDGEEGEKSDKSGKGSGEKSDKDKKKNKDKGKGDKGDDDDESESKDGKGDTDKSESKDSDGDDGKGELTDKEREEAKKMLGDKDEDEKKEEGEDGKCDGDCNRCQKTSGGDADSDGKVCEGDCSEWNEVPLNVDDMIGREVKKFCKEHPLGLDKDGKPNPHIRTSRGRNRKPHIPASTKYDREIDETGKGNCKRYNELKAEIHPQVASVKHWFEKVLKVQENVHWKTERERGMINGRSLNQLVSNPNYRTPFKEQCRTETNNVAVEILIDLSASMSGSKIQTAKLTAIAMAEALNALQIPFEITGWHSCGDSGMAREFGHHHGGGHYNRTHERLNTYIYKRFDSAVLNGLEKIKCGSENPDGEAVKWAANRLAIQKQNRKIMFVLSDGYPCTADSDNEILNHDLDEAVKKIKKAGIEIVGIGIESSAVRDFYPDYLVINDVSELPKGALQKLARIITKAG